MTGLDSYDYVVVGAGISGLAFVDSLLSHSDARIALVDRRPHPGGHWNDAYPFIRLHLPSHMYGVNSRCFTGENTLGTGANRHLLHLASGTEVLAYCKDVLVGFLAMPGRVTCYLGHEFDWSRNVAVSCVDGSWTHLKAKVAIVDATQAEPSLPALKRPSFMVEEGCPLIPGNELPDRLGETRRYCVIGGGKSGVDACLWLMDNGVVPTDIRWIVPRQPWWIVRERLQFTLSLWKRRCRLSRISWRVWRRPARSMTSFLASRSGEWLSASIRESPRPPIEVRRFRCPNSRHSVGSRMWSGLVASGRLVEAR